MKSLIVPWSTAVDQLLNRGVGVVPTDTVYGLVARASDPSAVARLYALKNRQAKPGTLVAASVEQLEKLGITSPHLARAATFWPGPVSVVIPLEDSLAYLHQGVGSLAIRIPKNPEFIAILTQTGPLQTTSANDPGAPTATTIQQAIDYFGSKVDFYVDGGDRAGRGSSTIVRLNDDGTTETLRHDTPSLSS